MYVKVDEITTLPTLISIYCISPPKWAEIILPPVINKVLLTEFHIQSIKLQSKQFTPRYVVKGSDVIKTIYISISI